jgi:hypothetical protein
MPPATARSRSNEAYQFAFNETLGRTVDTRGGAQHPSYDISLSGSGDVVMTDLRQMSATLVLGEDLDGRFFIRNAAQELVVELYKPFGRKVELGLEPGTYEVRLDRAKTSMLAKTKVDEGATLALDARQFGPVALEATHKRGNDMHMPFAVRGRHRVDLLLGGSGAYAGASSGVSYVDSVNMFAGLQYSVFPREDLGVTFGLLGRGAASSSVVNKQGVFSSDSALFGMPIGVRWNPIASRHPSSQLKPFVAATVGPVFVAASEASVVGSNVNSGDFIATTVGGDVLLGADFHIARWFSVTVSGGYNWMGNFSRPIGARDNLSGAEFGFGFGFLFGKGR